MNPIAHFPKPILFARITVLTCSPFLKFWKPNFVSLPNLSSYSSRAQNVDLYSLRDNELMLWFSFPQVIIWPVCKAIFKHTLCFLTCFLAGKLEVSNLDGQHLLTQMLSKDQNLQVDSIYGREQICQVSGLNHVIMSTF